MYLADWINFWDVLFKWGTKWEAAWLKIKEWNLCENILIPFTPELPVILANAICPFGLSAMLLLRESNGGERAIAFALRTLTISERNFS